MKQSTTVALMGIAIVAVVSSMGLDGIFATSYSPSQDTTDKTLPATTNMLGHITLVERDSHGNIKSYQQTDNLITNTGVDCTAGDLFSGHTSHSCGVNGTAVFDVIALGTGTGAPAATDTALGTEINANDFGLGASDSRAKATATDSAAASGTTTVTIANTYTSTTSVAGIAEAGVFDSTTEGAGDMLAHQKFASAVSLNSGDSLTVTWTITTT
ncbi:MAG: hypothetical protein WAN47_07225 [Nitrosotalea sp.]